MHLCKVRPLRPAEATEVEVPAAGHRDGRVICLARDAGCLPFGVVSELRRKLGQGACVVCWAEVHVPFAAAHHILLRRTAAS